MAKRFSTTEKEERLQQIKSFLTDGMSVQEACKKSKISVPTYYKWNGKKGGSAVRLTGVPTEGRRGRPPSSPSSHGDNGFLVYGSPDFVERVAGLLGVSR